MTNSQLERRVRTLTAAVCGLTVLLGLFVLGGFSMDRSGHLLKPERIEADTVAAQVVMTEQVEVVDRGVVRVRIGGQLPDASANAPRGGVPAGVLLYDDTGGERGGYVTFDEAGTVLLTLDGRQQQNALFVADTSGATALRIWYEDDAVELRADQDGARLTAVRDGRVVLQDPPITDPESSATCATLRSLRGQADAERLLQACRQRMTEDFCQTCLGQQ